ncbi:MAG: phosphatidate cytidylyltransferase [Verrucomicrobia bacterium]|nr:phosphatidate cytidylyltransferase [Verrucomicrobiota bacterium]
MSKRATLVRRSISSVLLWALVIGAILSSDKFASRCVFLAIVLGLTGLGLREFYSLAGARLSESYRYWGLIGGLLLVGSTFLYLSGLFGPHLDPAGANDFETAFLILFVLGLCLRRLVSTHTSDGVFSVSVTLFGILYVAWLLNFIQKIYFFPSVDGAFYVLYFILVTKFSDLGAYVTGSLFGRHKMIPRISPGKTWEGFAGAVVISTLVSVVFALSAQDRLAGMSLWHSVLLGALLSSTAVVGDLIESLFKREAGVKDSGRLFPGIGGVLDLLDSLLFNAPLMYLYLRHILVG